MQVVYTLRLRKKESSDTCFFFFFKLATFLIPVGAWLSSLSPANLNLKAAHLKRAPLFFSSHIRITRLVTLPSSNHPHLPNSNNVPRSSPPDPHVRLPKTPTFPLYLNRSTPAFRSPTTRNEYSQTRIQISQTRKRCL